MLAIAALELGLDYRAAFVSETRFGLNDRPVDLTILLFVEPFVKLKDVRSSALR